MHHLPCHHSLVQTHNARPHTPYGSQKEFLLLCMVFSLYEVVMKYNFPYWELILYSESYFSLNKKIENISSVCCHVQ